MKLNFRPLVIALTVIVILLIARFILSSPIGDQLLERVRVSKLQRSQNVTPAEGVKTSSSFSGVWQPESFSDYQVIIKNDLLKPLGWQETVYTPPPPEPVVQRGIKQERRAPTNDLVLTGIVRLGAAPTALVEDASKGEAYFLREGDKLKDYIVEAIGEESITLANESSRIVVALGSKTNYGSNGRVLISEMTDGQTTGDSVESTDEKTASSDEGTANMSLIEQMKARRREELGQE